MQRLLTSAVAVPLALAGIFLLPPAWFVLGVLVVVELAVLEYVRLTRRWAPHAPRHVLLLLVPAVSLMLCPGLFSGDHGTVPWEYLLVLGAVLSVGVGLVTLFGRPPIEESAAALGIVSFGLVYLALPVASMYYVQRLDPWLVLLLVAVVWLGDTAAFYAGTRWGRRRLAPVVSPNKTWEGAAGAFLAAMAAAAVWSALRTGEVRGAVLLLAGATSLAAQTGDLVESMLKRGAGIKDSGDLLPGHGGVLDRIDALLFAAPVFAIGIWVAGVEALSR